MAYSFQQLVQYAEQGGFPAAVAPTAAAIALAESSGNNVIQQGQPYSTTGWGLWQITPGNSVPGIGVNNALLDPVANARAAFVKYQGAGNSFRPWTTFTSGKYRQFMQGGVAGGGAPGANVNGGAPVSAGGGAPLDGVANALGGIGQSFAGIAGFADKLNTLTLPQTWVRIMAGIFGAGLVGFGVVMLTREVRH